MNATALKKSTQIKEFLFLAIFISSVFSSCGPSYEKGRSKKQATTEPTLVDGDILVDADENSLGLAGFGGRDGKNLWPNGIIPYVIDAAIPQPGKVAIRRVMNYWGRHTPIRFVPRSNQQGYLRIKWKICQPSVSCHFSAYLGYQPQEQIFNFPDRTYANILASGQNHLHSVISHELGHIAGLLHEHARFDRDRYLDGVSNAIANKQGFQNNLFTEFDPNSVMIYETLRVKDGTRTQWPEFLSQLDIKGLNELYGPKNCSIRYAYDWLSQSIRRGQFTDAQCQNICSEYRRNNPTTDYTACTNTGRIIEVFSANNTLPAGVFDSAKAKLARRLNKDLNLGKARGGYFENWGGLGEKYMFSNIGWCLILPNGNLYLWNRVKGQTGGLIASLAVEYYNDPALLHESD